MHPLPGERRGIWHSRRALGFHVRTGAAGMGRSRVARVQLPLGEESPRLAGLSMSSTVSTLTPDFDTT